MCLFFFFGIWASAFNSIRNYYVLTFGPDLVLITFDSDHTTEVTEQNAWLEHTLQHYSDKWWKLIQYHVAAWPSVRDFQGEKPRKIRENRVPLLEQYGVTLSLRRMTIFTKETVPIKQNKHDNGEGIIYIGNGGWSAPVSAAKSSQDYWLLDQALMLDHFRKPTLSANGERLDVKPVIRYPVGGFVLE